MGYILNTETKKVHNKENPCHYCIRTADKNKKAFDTEEEIKAYLCEGKSYELCGICFKSKKKGSKK